MFPILLEGGLTFSAVFSEFKTAFGEVIIFFGTNTVFLALIGLSVGAIAVGTVVKIIR